MPLSGSILSLKDPTVSGLSYQPLLLAQFTFPDGSTLYASTHNLSAAEGGNTYGGNAYLARIQGQDIAAIQSRGEQGIDRVSDVTLHLFNADQFLWTNYETAAGKGFKGALLKLSLVLMDVDATTGAYTFTNDSPAPVKFNGICDAPMCENGGEMMTIRASTSHSLDRVAFPILHVQQRCINPFPGTPSQQAQANDPSSWFFDCGYDNGVTAGNPGFAGCGYTKSDCQARGMYDHDSHGRRTSRFRAIQWAPAQVEGHGIQYTSGKKVVTFSNRNDSIYDRAYPMLYGNQWVKNPIIANIIGDANSTRMEVVICLGDIGSATSITQVVVNGVIVPMKGAAGWDPLFRWNFLDQQTYNSGATGDRSGFINQDAGYNGLGDPYGGLATIEIVVYVELAANNAAPDVRILCQGPKVRTPNTANPADVLAWPNVPSTLPPWVLLDLLIWGNYTYAEVDLQSFIDAANFCGGQVTYTDLNGLSRTHNRYICELAMTDRSQGSGVVQAVLRSFNAQLIENPNTGLLQLRIRQTLADQQPSPVPGSNYNQPVQSVHADGSVGSGYVAYRIDESVLLDSDGGRGIPKVRGPYCALSAQVANRLTWPFQDSDNHYADDSISVVDTDDVARAGGYQAGGQQIQQQLAVLGITNFDQGIRVANALLAEQLRGNENQDTRGSRLWDIDCTSRMEHLRGGDIVLLTYQALVNSGALLPGGLQPIVPLQSPPGVQIPGILARVDSIKPATNYERATFTLRWHEDYWYTDSYGQHAAPPFSGITLLPQRAPYPWKPFGQQPIAGDSMRSSSEWSFNIAPNYSVAADGSAIATLAVAGNPPVNQFSTLAPPFLGLQGATGNAGGNIAGGQRIYMAIAAQDSSGAWSLPSRSCMVDIPTGTNTNTVTTPTISWQAGTVAWALFAGTDEQNWSAQASGSGTPSTISVSSLNVATYGAPDIMVDSLLLRVKRIFHGGVWGDACTAVNSGRITFGTAVTSHQFAGYDLTKVANQQSSGANVPIADFRVIDNIGSTYFVTPDPLAVGCTAGDVFEMRALPSIITATTIGDNDFVNAYAPAGLAPGAEIGHRVRIIAGTGRGQERNIVANDATSVTVDSAWDTTPDATSRFILEETGWPSEQVAKLACASLTVSPVPVVANVGVDNYRGQSILVQAVTQDADGNASIARFAPTREIYLWGGQGTTTVDTPTVPPVSSGLPVVTAITASEVANSVYQDSNQGLHMVVVVDPTYSAAATAFPLLTTVWIDFDDGNGYINQGTFNTASAAATFRLGDPIQSTQGVASAGNIWVPTDPTKVTWRVAAAVGSYTGNTIPVGAATATFTVLAATAAPPTDISNAVFVANPATGNVLDYAPGGVGGYYWQYYEIDWTQPTLAANPYYKGSFITVQKGYAATGTGTVTGGVNLQSTAGTVFASSDLGNDIHVNGTLTTILRVTDTTHIVLASAIANGTGQSYEIWRPAPDHEGLNDPNMAGIYLGRQFVDSGGIQGGVSYPGTTVRLPGPIPPTWDFPMVTLPDGTTNLYRTYRFRMYSNSRRLENVNGAGTESTTLQVCWQSNSADHFDVTPAQQPSALDLTQSNQHTTGPNLTPDPNNGNKLTVPNTNQQASLIPDPSFEYSTVGQVVLNGVFVSPIQGFLPSWSTTGGGTQNVAVRGDGGNSGPNYVRLSGSAAQISTLFTCQPGETLAIQMHFRDDGVIARPFHSLALNISWRDASNAQIGAQFTACSVANSLGDTAWHTAFGFPAAAPAGTVKAMAIISTAFSDPAYWDVDDIQIQQYVNQTANNQTTTTAPASGGSDFSALRALSTLNLASSYYGLSAMILTASGGNLAGCFAFSDGGGGAQVEVQDATGHFGVGLQADSTQAQIVVHQSGVTYNGQNIIIQDNLGVNHTVKCGLIVS